MVVKGKGQNNVKLKINRGIRKGETKEGEDDNE